MKFAYSWLYEFVDPGLDVDALAHRLTMAGIEVEQLTTGAPFKGVVAAQVISVSPHPKADRLKVCQVDAGGPAPRQIVCAAPDVAAGMMTACALPGAQLEDKIIAETEFRGVGSSGMLCSAQELGLASDSDGLMRLARDAKPGTDLAELLGLNEAVFTLKLTPNRSDCLSIFGVAREIAAVTGAILRRPDIVDVVLESDAQREISIKTPACPRYCGRMIEGIDPVAKTPENMIARLAAAGVRAHSAVVDITNYVMLEVGQPMHAFDANRLIGDIVIREAQSGEKLELLNQTQITLQGDEVVISDAKGPVALAGVMGGAASAVGATTQTIFLESAFFSPDAIAGMTRRFNLVSDSAYRFERGVDFAATRAALERATALILEICGGRAGPVGEVIGALPARAPILLRAASTERLLGIQLSQDAAAGLLRKLGLAVEIAPAGLRATPPSFRFDLAIEADLIEEVARLYGYDNIIARKPLAELSMLPNSERVRRLDTVADNLCARDYQEIVTYSFVEAELQRDLDGAAAITLQNPIASQMSVMRSSLIPGLVQTARFNLDRQHARVRVFEIGRCFAADDDVAQQPWRVAGLCLGSAAAEQWGLATRTVDFYDVKADIEALFATPVRFAPTTYPATHPGQSAQVVCGEHVCGWLGTLHPRWQQKYGLRDAVIFELDRDALLGQALPVQKDLSKFPAVMRDIACIVEDKFNVQTIIDDLKQGLPDFVTELRLFDIYRGKGIDLGKKSLAFRLFMQDTKKTLSEDEIERVMGQVTHALQTRFGATLR